MAKKSSLTLKRLILLIFTFTIGVIALISLHLFILNIFNKLDKKTENLQAKMKIGQFIVNDLYKIRSDFYELATTVTNIKSIDIINKKIETNLKTIQESLRVLEKGGSLKKTIRLNIAGHNETTKIINYKKDKETISLEVIDLNPKIEEFKTKLKRLNILLKEQASYRKNADSVHFMQQNKEIKRLYKTSPAFFTRIIENANRLLYEGSIELQKIEKTTLEQKEYYVKLELILILGVLFLVMILGFLIAIQINKNAKELEKQEQSTRGILDAQQNIVIVTNGEYMIDANSALINFFDGYNSFEDFSSKHICICDFFEEIEGEDYIIDTNYDGKMWFEYILDNPQKLHKVAIYKKDELNYFIITATKKYISNSNFIVIVALNNITTDVKTQKELKRLNDNLEDIVNDKTKELKELNENLEQKVQVEVEKNREKDKVLIRQGRYAALGEMIGNIAHQWRQPLSAISSTSTSLQLQMSLNLVSNQEIDKGLNSINKYVKFLNQTIEDFRGFFRKDKDEIEFDLIDAIKNSTTITNALYKNYSIEIIFEFKDKNFIAKGFPNELSQVFLNILNNAKDALLPKKIERKFVKIKLYEKNKKNIIEFIDNAGGINENVLDKIFDPYFTTKHKSQGTGIGLYMSKDIIEKHMKGSLQAFNTTFEHQDIKVKGACFRIELPKRV